MNVLLDTDTCVYALRGHPAVRSRLTVIDPATVAISVVTLAELRYGAACSARPDANHQAVDDFVQAISLIGVDPAIARAFGEIKLDLRRQGSLIEDFDLLIAATARTYRLTLVTNNQDHFRRIPDLTLDNWI